MGQRRTGGGVGQRRTGGGGRQRRARGGVGQRKVGFRGERRNELVVRRASRNS